MRKSNFVSSLTEGLAREIRREAPAIAAHVFAVWLAHQPRTIIALALVLLAAIAFRAK
jgi:hypothetical protein